MTAPDILPHLGDLILLALFIVGAGSLTFALWLKEARIKELEVNAAELDERLAHQEKMQREMAKIMERFVGTLVNDALGDKAAGNGRLVMDRAMPMRGRNGWGES